jgi:hypothetical protein
MKGIHGKLVPLSIDAHRNVAGVVRDLRVAVYTSFSRLKRRLCSAVIVVVVAITFVLFF